VESCLDQAVEEFAASIAAVFALMLTNDFLAVDDGYVLALTVLARHALNLSHSTLLIAAAM